MRRDQIALQLYTVRDLAKTDLQGTLRAVADAGYRSVEVAGVPETSLGELPRLFDETGLRAIASHEAIDRLRKNASAVADRLNELGCPRAIVASIPDAERGTADDVRRFAAELNGFAGPLAERGIRLGYHNHSFEFEPLAGTTTWDILLAELSGDVDIELDLYWASVGGRDPVSEMRALDGRVRLLHMKDRAPGAVAADAPPGEGTLAWREIVATGRDVGVEWYIVEQDDPNDALVDITTGLRYLEGLAG